MQSLGTNLLLSDSLILNPRAVLNRMERQFIECDLKAETESVRKMLAVSV